MSPMGTPNTTPASAPGKAGPPTGPSFAGPGTVGRASFLPEEYVRQRAAARANMLGMVLSGVVLAAVAGAFLVTNQAWSSVKARRTAVDAQYAEQAKKIDELRRLEAQTNEMMDKALITTALIERVPRSILMAELINRLPERVMLTDLQLVSKRIADPVQAVKPGPQSLSTTKKPDGSDAKKDTPPRPRPPRLEYTLTLTGYSASDAGVADYQSALGGCGLLHRVDLVSSVEAMVDKVTVRRFKLEATLRGEADARKIEPLHVARVPAHAGPAGAPPRAQASVDERRERSEP